MRIRIRVKSWIKKGALEGLYRPVVADFHHFKEKMGPDPHLSQKLDPDPVYCTWAAICACCCAIMA
jgi:hypothetical protein